MYLSIKDIHKSFINEKNEKTNVLHSISMEIKQGSFVSVVGPSGCGKSTLLDIIAGLERADSGDISVAGKSVTAPGPDRVVVFQEDGLFPWLTVLENVMYGLKVKKIPKSEAENKAKNMLEMVHLTTYIHSYPHQLSGGMKQRVAIARALVLEPAILLMDEPFSALDEQTKMILHNELLELWRKRNITICFVTHDIREAVTLSEKIVVMATRPGSIKDIITVPETHVDGMPNEVALELEKKILAILQAEIKKR